MKNPLTSKTIRYRVQDTNGQVLDVFGQKKNAFTKAIILAMEFRGTTFIVVRKTSLKEKTIFQFSFNAQYDFGDLKEINKSFLEVFESKSKITGNWFKP